MRPVAVCLPLFIGTTSRMPTGDAITLSIQVANDLPFGLDTSSMVSGVAKVVPESFHVATPAGPDQTAGF